LLITSAFSLSVVTSLPYLLIRVGQSTWLCPLLASCENEPYAGQNQDTFLEEHPLILLRYFTCVSLFALFPREPLAHLRKTSDVLQCSQHVSEQQAEGPCYHPIPLTLACHLTACYGKPDIICLPPIPFLLLWYSTCLCNSSSYTYIFTAFFFFLTMWYLQIHL